MFTPLRVPSHPPTPPLSTEAQPLPFKCPKCGTQLRVHNTRIDLDADGQIERVFVYLCFQDGLYTFRYSRGLVEGL